MGAEIDTKNYENPAHFFSMAIPATFQCKNENALLYCNSADGATITVSVTEIPPSSHVGLIALVNKQKYGKFSQFKLIQERKVLVDQLPAIVQAFSFNVLGKVQLERFGQQLFIVQANKLITVEFFCGAALAESYSAFREGIHNLLQIARWSASGKVLRRAGSPNTLAVLNPQLERLLKSFR